MPCYIAEEDSPTVVADDEEAVDHSESERGYGEEIHRRDGFTVVAEERGPTLGRLRPSRCLSHPPKYAPLGDVVAKHLEFTMNPRCSPRRVLGHHAIDEVSKLLADRLPANWSTRP